jgi:hypothetical protein
VTKFIPDGADAWVNGICNTVDANTDEMLIGVLQGAHASGATVVIARRAAYMTEWAWPSDMPGLGVN